MKKAAIFKFKGIALLNDFVAYVLSKGIEYNLLYSYEREDILTNEFIICANFEQNDLGIIQQSVFGKHIIHLIEF